MEPKFWFMNYDNIVLLTEYMAENDFEASEVARAVKTPWEFTLVFNDATSD